MQIADRKKVMGGTKKYIHIYIFLWSKLYFMEEVQKNLSYEGPFFALKKIVRGSKKNFVWEGQIFFSSFFSLSKNIFLGGPIFCRAAVGNCIWNKGNCNWESQYAELYPPSLVTPGTVCLPLCVYKGWEPEGFYGGIVVMGKPASVLDFVNYVWNIGISE